MHAHKLSEEFHRLSLSFHQKDVTLKELARHTDSNAQAFFTLLLSLPFLFFIPLPGLSTLFGVFIMVNGIRITARKKLWFPRFLSERKISVYALKKMLKTAHRWAVRLERLVQPRGRLLHKHPFFCKVNGLMLMVSGLFLALPLPPGTNFLPALTTFLLSLGILEEDSYCLVVSYFFFVLCLAFYIALPTIGLSEYFSVSAILFHDIYRG
jgi:hypothetical protein